MGVYTIDQPYRVDVAIDRSDQSVSIGMRSEVEASFTGHALLVESSSAPFSSHILSDPLAVAGGTRYTLETVANVLDPGPVGISVEWFDSELERIDVVSQWERRTAGVGWSGMTLSADAPSAAEWAIIELATAGESNALFSDVRFEPADDTSDNLLPNGAFEAGGLGWRRAEGTAPLETRTYSVQGFSGLVSVEDWPALFAATRLAVSVGSASTTGLAVTRVEDHHLVLSHDRWLAVQVDDPLLKTIVVVLGGLGVLIVAGLLWGAFRSRHGGRPNQGWSRSVDNKQLKRWLGVGALILLFLLGNALLSSVGSSNADIVGARTWGYTVSTGGPEELYFASNVASVEAEQWSGLPLQEAGFPYGPTMAYITSVQGLAHRYFFNSPGVSDNIGVLNLMAKLVNSLFALADAAVIYLIVRSSLPRKIAAAGALAFLLNPAVWFAGSVWGSSQAVSLLFLLLALYFTQRSSLYWAWTFLIVAVMARPQYAIPAVLLAIYLAREARVRESVVAISKAVISVFVILLPFSLLISPTLPVDNLFNAFFLHVGTGNDTWTLPLSWGGLSVWPLVVPLFYDLSGIGRVLFPAQTEAFGAMTFFEAGTLLVVGVVAALAIRTLFRQPERRPQMSISVLMAAATMALFTLKTGTPTYHFILPLALLIAARASLPRFAYWTSVAILSTTAFVSMYAMGSYWLTRHPTWSVGLYDEGNPVSRVFATMADQDWYIVVGSVANLLVLGMLLWFSFRPFYAPLAMGQLPTVGEFEVEDDPSAARADSVLS